MPTIPAGTVILPGGGTNSNANAPYLTTSQLQIPSIIHQWRCNDAAGTTALADSVGSSTLSVGSAATVGVPGLLNDGATGVFLQGNGSTNSYLQQTSVLPVSGAMCVEFVTTLYHSIGNSSDVGALVSLGTSGGGLDLNVRPNGGGYEFEWAPYQTDTTFYYGFPIGVPLLIHTEIDGSGGCYGSINGVPIYSAASGFVSSLTPTLTIGMYGYTPEFTPTMQVQNIAVYNARLTTAQKQANVNAMKGVVTSNSFPSTPFYSFPIDVPPTSPSIYDDEFTKPTLNSKWTILNSTSGDTGRVTYIDTSGPGFVVFENPYTTGDRFYGIIENAPSSNWTMTCKVNMEAGGNAYPGPVIIVQGSNGKYISLGVFQYSDTYGMVAYTETLNSDLSYNSGATGTTFSSFGPFYLRVKWDGTNLTLYVTTGGHFPTTFYTMQYASAASWFGSGNPTGFGIGFEPYGSTGLFSFDWVRVTTP